MATVDKFITALKKYTGVPYLYGGKTAKALDCSGLITLALKDIDVSFPHGSDNQIAASSSISVAEAIKTPGALLFMPGHIAVSLGDGTTFEARNSKSPVGVQPANGRGWTRGGRINSLTYSIQDKAMATKITMVSPVKGSVSSRYGWRTLSGKANFHAGLDIATGEVGVPVYAPFAGTVSNVVSSRVHDRSAAQTKNAGKARVANWLSGNGCRVNNPDGETQAFGHIRPVVKNGQKVAKGQLLGHIDLSGNTTGPHLHFETWNSKGDHGNPEVWFKAHRITPGSSPVFPTNTPAIKPTPAPKPATKSDPKVLAWQKRQNKYGKAGLLEDGIRGPVSIAWENWVKALQKQLRSWKGVASNLLIDGDYGATTHESVKTVQRRNGLHVDGFAQAVTIKFMRSKGSTVPYRP